MMRIIVLFMFVYAYIYIYIFKGHTHRHTFVSVPNWEGGRHQEKLSILLSYVSQQENDQPFVDET